VWKTGNFLVENWKLSGLELVTFWSGTGNFLLGNWWLSVVWLESDKWHGSGHRV